MKKPVICIVGTGGTIASRYDARLGGHVSAATAADLAAAVPQLDKIADIRVIEHSNINSALMDTPTASACATRCARPWRMTMLPARW
jgi:L-asparaginase/Glu-tRNA(Gln) amidotransferase subunit D